MHLVKVDEGLTVEVRAVGLREIGPWEGVGGAQLDAPFTRRRGNRQVS
jgi:hypothetical protein